MDHTTKPNQERRRARPEVDFLGIIFLFIPRQNCQHGLREHPARDGKAGDDGRERLHVLDKNRKLGADNSDGEIEIIFHFWTAAARRGAKT